MEKETNKARPYSVLVTSEEFGTEAFDYEDLSEALDGLGRLVLAGIKLRDKIERWYCIRPTDELTGGRD